MLITRGVSLAILAPLSPWASKIIEHWDYASAAGITRTMLEARLAFYYLCTDACSSEEWDCRWNIFNLHDCTSRNRLFAAHPEDRADEVAGFEAQAEELRGRLRANLFFQTLPLGQQRRLLNGQTAFLYPLEEIAEKAGVDRQTFRWIYVLLSAHVHSLPMSFYRMHPEHPDRGRGLPSPVEEGYTALCLSFSASLLVHTRDEIETLFKDVSRPKLSVPEQEESTSHGEEVADQDVNGNGLSIGEETEYSPTPEIRVRISRTSDDTYTISYSAQPNDDEVLKYALSNGQSDLEVLDAVFWTITVDGAPATNAKLDDALSKQFAFRADPKTRTLRFKTPGVEPAIIK